MPVLKIQTTAKAWVKREIMLHAWVLKKSTKAEDHMFKLYLRMSWKVAKQRGITALMANRIKFEGNL